MSTVPPALLHQVVQVACRAPSVHNTQPWRWRLGGGPVLELYADHERQLTVSDPDGRNLTISCGAALHCAVLAGAALGLEARVERTSAQTGLLAAIRFSSGAVSSDTVTSLQGLDERHTDRRRFTAWPVPGARLLELAQAAASSGALVVPLGGHATRAGIDLLLSRALTAQAADERFAHERRVWQAPATEAVALASTDGLVALCTTEDGPPAWLRAGEGLSALWFAAAREGLSVVPMSQVVEVEETRAALRYAHLGGQLHPQLLVRVGWQEIGRSTLPRTPRRAVADVLVGGDVRDSAAPPGSRRPAC